MQPDDFDHPVGGGAGRKEADVFPGFVDQINERGVVDHVIGAAVRILGVIDLVGEGSPGSCPSCIPPDAGLDHYGRGGVAAVATVLASMLAISRRATAAGMTAFMIRLTWPGMMTDRQMRTCWQALYQSSPLRFSAQEKRARGRSRCGSAGLE